MTTSRRDFLLLVSLSSAGLVLAACLKPKTADEAPPFRPNLWLVIHPDGSVEFNVTRLEMGQGIRTALTLMVADELVLAPERIRLHSPSTGEMPNHGKILATASSVSVSDHWTPLRAAAAAAREMLIGAAAEEWGVAAAECEMADGFVRHRASGRQRGIGELVAAAARQPVPEKPRPRRVGEFRYIGRPTRRLENPDIVTGRPRYGGDVRLAGLRYAVVARPPVTGGTARSVDPGPALAIPGVQRVVPLRRGVAVVADDSWSAIAGREALRIDWQAGDEEFSSQRFDREARAALDVAVSGIGYQYPKRGPRAIFVSDRRHKAPPEMPDTPPSLEAEFATGFQTHMAMETRNATARIAGRKCEIWTGHQHPHRVVEEVAEKLGFKADDVNVHALPMGGGFGGREDPMFAVEAAELAQALDGGPVQVLWTREDETSSCLFHPGSRHRLQGWLDRSGRLAAWRHRVAAPSVEIRWGMTPRLIGQAEAAGAWNMHYACERVRVEYADLAVPVPLGFWRGIAFNQNNLAVECFVDELAALARRDPVEFRLAHLRRAVTSLGAEGQYFDLSRLRAAMKLAAERGDWGSPLPPGRGRGFAALVFDGRTAVATVAEVTVDGAALSIDRIVCALDCGVVVNPLGLESNAQGAVAWALSALFAEITFDRGRVVESNHLDYPILRLPQMPAVEILTVASDQPPSGTGEAPVPTIAPAVLNAIHDATGRRLRRLPIRPQDWT